MNFSKFQKQVFTEHFWSTALHRLTRHRSQLFIKTVLAKKHKILGNAHVPQSLFNKAAENCNPKECCKLLGDKCQKGRTRNLLFIFLLDITLKDI